MAIIKVLVIVMIIVLLVRSFFISQNEGNGSLWDIFAGLSIINNLLPVRNCKDMKVINQLLFVFYMLFGICLILIFVLMILEKK